MIHSIRTLSVAFALLIFSLSLYAHGVKVVVIPMGGDAEPLHNVITVSKKNGDFTDPVAAMASIEGLADESNRYLIFIGPGVYVLTKTLVMQEYVDISGSGQNATKLTGAISSDSLNQVAALVQGADHAGIRNLTIENTGGNGTSIGVYNSYYSSPTMSDLVIAVSGCIGCVGVVNQDFSSPTMSDITIAVTGDNTGTGVYNDVLSSPKMSGIDIAVYGEYVTSGVSNRNSSSPTMSGMIIATSGGEYNYGVLNQASSSPIMSNTIITASASASGLGGGIAGSYGVHNVGSSSPAMSGMSITASGVSDNFGVFNTASSSARIQSSTISVSGGTANTSVSADTGSGSTQTYISDSILTGPVTGTPLCSFTFSNTGVDLTADCYP